MSTMKTIRWKIESSQVVVWLLGAQARQTRLIHRLTVFFIAELKTQI